MKELEWEVIQEDDGEPALFRAKVWMGWLLLSSAGSITYIPDSRYEWGKGDATL